MSDVDSNDSNDPDPPADAVSTSVSSPDASDASEEDAASDASSDASEDAAGLRTRQQLFDTFRHAVKGGARWRSEPVLDDDLCLLVRAPHILLPPRLDGFSALVSRLRYGRNSQVT